MLKQLRIQNFKRWEDTGHIDMAPITLFFGANSSGKSSIGQFLMMLKQTVESFDGNIVFNFGDTNSAVQLGSYKDMVFGHDLSKNISFEYKWVGQSDGKEIDFHADVEVDKQKIPRVKELGYRNLNEKFTAIGMKRQEGQKKQKYEIKTEPGDLRPSKRGPTWLPEAPVHFHAFPFKVQGYYNDIEFVDDLNLAQNKLFSSLFYLGPIRTKANRMYAWAGDNPGSVGYNGENTIAAILSAHRDKRKMNYGYNGRYKNFDKLITQQLQDMELLESIDVKRISGDEDAEGIYAVMVRAKNSDHEVSLPDLGFGVSQVLPVVVQCFCAPYDSIIIIEQPELHLHPVAQMQLADVMIDVINSRENGKDRNIQLIIETHSEHFLQRLQRRIAEKKIKEEQLSAYFANAIGRSATLEKLQINKTGHIENWPKDFFGDEMGEIMAQSKAALENG